MTPISTQQYLSGPVDFYRQTLGTGIQSSVIDDDDQKKEEEEEDTAPNIFKPIDLMMATEKTCLPCRWV